MSKLYMFSLANDRSTLVRLFLGVVVCIGPGCTDESGIIIDVTRDEDTTSSDIDRLRFFVGVPASVGSERFLDAADTAEDDVSLVEGRDILADPYRLLLTDGSIVGDSLMVAVAGYSGSTLVAFGGLDHAVPFERGALVEWPVVLRGARGDRVEVTGTGCLRWTLDRSLDELREVTIATPVDQDCDGDIAPDDCDDLNPEVGPSQQESCGNEVDDNCNGEVDETVDEDGDMFDNCSDCNDMDASVHPGAEEPCDGIDNNCVDGCDESCDVDGDGFTTHGRRILVDGSCSDEDPALADCADNVPEIHPDAEEVCDGLDNNCDGRCDDPFDPDGDRYTVCGSKVDACEGTMEKYVDCAPDDPAVHPSQAERCDGLDTDCRPGRYRQLSQCYELDNSGEGRCFLGTRTCDDADDGEGWGDCLANGATGGESVLPSLCAAYEQCDANEVADPFACANNGAVADTISCQLFYNDQDLCDNAVFPLPNQAEANASCHWFTIPNMPPAGYSTSVRSQENPSIGGQSVNECEALFQVDALVSPQPQIDSYMLYQSVDGVATQALRVQLVPTFGGTCPMEGLSCSTMLRR